MLEVNRQQFHRYFDELRGKSREFLEDEITSVTMRNEAGQPVELLIIEDPDVADQFMVVLADEVAEVKAEPAKPPATVDGKGEHQLQ